MGFRIPESSRREVTPRHSIVKKYILSRLVCSGSCHPLPTACTVACITIHERTYLRRMINRGYAEGREVSSACGEHRYEQTRIETPSQDIRFPAAHDQCLPPLCCSSRPISRRSQRRSQALAPDPEFIPLNKHHTQSVSPMCATLCVLYSVFRVLSSRSLMRPVSASGTCRLVTAAARGQMSFPCSLVAVDKVLPSYTRRGSVPLNS